MRKKLRNTTVRKEVVSMPRMSRSNKEMNSFFLDDKGRIKYNEQCRKCVNQCKQSYRAVIICCPSYKSKRATK